MDEQDEQWRTLEAAYLAADDPRGGSGFRGDAARWERLRRPIVAAVDRDGAFLDVGCANGHLLESVVAWAAADGHRIDPFGLDVSAALVARARERLWRWSEHLYVGDVRSWTPPRRFDFVRTELCYWPGHESALIERLLQVAVQPGGRLVACCYSSRSHPERDPLVDVAGALERWGYRVGGSAVGRDADGLLLTTVAWIDAAPEVTRRCAGGPVRRPPAGADR